MKPPKTAAVFVWVFGTYGALLGVILTFVLMADDASAWLRGLAGFCGICVLVQMVMSYRQLSDYGYTDAIQQHYQSRVDQGLVPGWPWRRRPE